MAFVRHSIHGRRYRTRTIMVTKWMTKIRRHVKMSKMDMEIHTWKYITRTRRHTRARYRATRNRKRHPRTKECDDPIYLLITGYFYFRARVRANARDTISVRTFSIQSPTAANALHYVTLDNSTRGTTKCLIFCESLRFISFRSRYVTRYRLFNAWLGFRHFRIREKTSAIAPRRG